MTIPEDVDPSDTFDLDEINWRDERKRVVADLVNVPGAVNYVTLEAVEPKPLDMGFGAEHRMVFVFTEVGTGEMFGVECDDDQALLLARQIHDILEGERR